jgi:hypothetical protein
MSTALLRHALLLAVVVTFTFSSLAGAEPLAPRAELEDQPARVYALIVAHNKSYGEGLADLRYADDDGARYFELFSSIAHRVELLSVLDVESQRVFSRVAAASRPPTRRELLATLESMFTEMSRDRAEGRRALFYFVYAGHGSVGEDGEGSVHLLDGRFTRADLYQSLLARSPATMNHLIIDACNAYLMVARRGGQVSEAQVKHALDGFLSRESLDHYPNTGVLVSTTQAAEVHEWSRFEAGIFSHQVRSGLVGAADVDGDGKVTYAELRAFVSAANARVSDPKAKLKVFARAPAMHVEEPVFDRRRARLSKTLTVPGQLAGRYYLEDARGVRYADFHSAAGSVVRLLLLPGDLYFLRSDTQEIRIPLELAAVEVDAGDLPSQPAELATRGSEALTFQRDLFAVPFGMAYFDGFAGSVAEEDRSAPELTLTTRASGGLPGTKIAALGAGGTGLLALAAGVGFGVAASARASAYRTGIGDDDDLLPLRDESQSLAARANALYAVGGGLLVTGLVLWLWPDE